MKKVELRYMENHKYEIIKNLVDHNGNKKRAASKLNCSIRTINRLIICYKKYGKAGFIHGNRGKSPACAIPKDIKSKIISMYLDEYSDTNYVHFCEIIKEDLGISISDTTLNRWLLDEDVLSPKAHKKTKKALKKKLKNQLNETSSEKVKNDIKLAIEDIEDHNAHTRRSRCKYMGEMIQMDASSFNWIKDEIWHLHLAVDDATGEVVGAYFDTQETLKGYYNVFYQILTNYGIPAMFYTDKRTVFEYQKKTKAFDDEDTFTQFSYACHNLGVDIKTTSVAQAKGRIERLNQTFQSRLPIELRRAHITCIADANEFLKSYLKKFNAQFALHLNITKSVFEKQPDKETIIRTLAVLSERKVDSGNAIKFKNKYYLPHSKNGDIIKLRPKMSVIVIEAFDKNLYLNAGDNIFVLEELQEHEKISKEFDAVSEVQKEKKRYIPPMSHPWKGASYRAFVSKQAHRSCA